MKTNNNSGFDSNGKVRNFWQATCGTVRLLRISYLREARLENRTGQVGEKVSVRVTRNVVRVGGQQLWLSDSQTSALMRLCDQLSQDLLQASLVKAGEEHSEQRVQTLVESEQQLGGGAQ